MLWKDFRIAARSLRRSPSFALAVVLTLAIAIGLATSVFSVLDAILLRPLPYKDAGGLAVIWSSFPNEAHGPVAFDDFEDWRRNSKTLESAAMYATFYKPILSGSGEPERVPTLLVSHQYFTVMGVHPVLGRFFLPVEDRDGADDLVVLSDRLWRTRFLADPAVIGRSMLLNSRPHTIVGVAGPDLMPLPPSLDDDPPQLYRPIGEPFGPGSRDGRHLRTLVRLRAGVSIEQAQAELNVRCKQMEKEHEADAHLGAGIAYLKDQLTRNVRGPLLALQAAVLILLLIACANVANLVLAKSSGRRREMAIREALGAGSWRLLRMLLAESAILGTAGGCCGVVLAMFGASGLTAIASRVLPDAGVIRIDARVLLFSLLLSVAASILFGIAPLARLQKAILEEALKPGGRVTGDRRNGLRQSLAALQIALALGLLVATGLLGKSFLRLRNMEPGFDARNVLVASVALPQTRYRKEDDAARFFERALAGLRATPGVTRAAAVSVVPMSGDFDRTGFQITGKQFLPGKQANPDRYIVTPEYFRTLRIPLLQGRTFTNGDDVNHSPVCVINATAARQWFQGQSPLGRKIRAGAASGDFDHSPFREVVGVVGDVAQYGLALPSTPQIYMPHAQFAVRYLSFVIRAAGDPLLLAGPVRRAVFAVDKEQPVYNIKPLDEIISNTIAARRLSVWLLAVFGLGALCLAAIGIYGVVSYSIAQRTSEFGIRIALGARPADVLRKAIADSLRMVAAGVICGIALSLVISRLIAGFLAGASAIDTPILCGVGLFLSLVALAACYAPARRASRIDPVIALRLD